MYVLYKVWHLIKSQEIIIVLLKYTTESSLRNCNKRLLTRYTQVERSCKCMTALGSERQLTAHST